MCTMTALPMTQRPQVGMVYNFILATTGISETERLKRK